VTFSATKHGVFNRGVPPDDFLAELTAWGKTAPEDIFAPNDHYDIFNKVKPELGPYETPIKRRAVMLEVMRVLAGFESSWDWTEGIDTSKTGADTDENAEAGAWQVSYDSRRIDPSLFSMLIGKGIVSGIEFQRIMKFDHTFAMEYAARLFRARNGWKANGPLYKDDERAAIRKSLRGPEQSIYPWILRSSTIEFEALLNTSEPSPA